MKRTIISIIIAICMVVTLIPPMAEDASASTTIKTVPVNSWIGWKSKGYDNTRTYKFVVPRSGWVRPVILVDDERSHNAEDLCSEAYITSASYKPVYAAIDYSTCEYIEGPTGHHWYRAYLEKTRLPAGTYYIRFKNGTYAHGYGHFKFKIHYKNESGINRVEKEFNGSRAKANSIVFNRKYYGNIAMNQKDIDYFKFTVNKKKKVTVYVYHPTSQIFAYAAGEGGAELYNSSGTYLTDADYMTTFEGNNGVVWNKYRITRTLAKGTYYLKMSGLEYCSNYYFIVK